MTENEVIEELKCYRAKCGTEYPEEIEIAISAISELQKYRAIGTVEECREAMEKQKQLKPQEILLHNGRKGFECKSCGNELSTNVFESAYCHWCGQKLGLGDVD